MINIITLKNINKKFGDNEVIKDFSVEVKQGDMIAISGRSGSGKTTLLNIIGLLEKPTKGDIFIAGIKNPIIETKQGREILKNKIGYLFQNYALVDNETVEYNLEIALKYRKGINKKDIIAETLKKVDLEGFEHKKVYTLSGGEQQRVALARIMIKPCEIVLADEPTGSLDKNNGSIVMRILKDINKDGKTIIIVTHDESFMNECNEIIRI